MNIDTVEIICDYLNCCDKRRILGVNKCFNKVLCKNPDVVALKSITENKTYCHVVKQKMKYFIKAMKFKNLEVVKWLFSLGIKCPKKYDYFFESVIRTSTVEIFEFLYFRFLNDIQEGIIIESVTRYGTIQHFNITIKGNVAVNSANNKDGIIEIVYPGTKKKVFVGSLCFIFRNACLYGKLEIAQKIFEIAQNNNLSFANNTILIGSPFNTTFMAAFYDARMLNHLAVAKWIYNVILQNSKGQLAKPICGGIPNITTDQLKMLFAHIIGTDMVHIAKWIYDKFLALSYQNDMILGQDVVEPSFITACRMDHYKMAKFIHSVRNISFHTYFDMFLHSCKRDNLDAVKMLYNLEKSKISAQVDFKRLYNTLLRTKSFEVIEWLSNIGKIKQLTYYTKN